MPALIRFGLAEKPAEPEKSLLKSPVSHADVEVDKQKVQALYSDWKQQPEATTTRDQLRDAVKELKQNAEVAGDTASAKSSEATLKAIDASFDPLKTGISEALADIAPAKPAEAPAPQMVQLIDAPAAEVDQELLDIFLEEATEVVATIRESLAVIRSAPHDKESLTTIRRGFHTLKGSGRMVGLTDLGEVAWSCEQVMNKWLKDERPATAGLIMLITESADSFAAWVATLQAKGTASIDGTRINELGDLLKNDKEPAAEPVIIVESAAQIIVPVQETVDDALVVSSENVDINKVDLTNENITTPQSIAALGELTLIDATESQAESLLAVPDEIVNTATDKPTDVETNVADLTDVSDTASTTTATLDITIPLESVGIEPPQIAVETTPIEPLPSVDMMLANNDVFAELPALAFPTSSSSSQPAEVMPHDIEEGEEVIIGHVRLPLPLYEIYLGEASQHVETLDGEMAIIEANPLNPVTHEFMRAAHTLTSSSRTTGFESVADVSFALEKWLSDAIELTPQFDAERLMQTRQAVDALANMVLSLHTHEYPEVRPDIVHELVTLREALKASARLGEGTHTKLPTSDTSAPLSMSMATEAFDRDNSASTETFDLASTESTVEIDATALISDQLAEPPKGLGS